MISNFSSRPGLTVYLITFSIYDDSTPILIINPFFQATLSEDETFQTKGSVFGLNVFLKTLPPHKSSESIFKHQSPVHINSTVTFQTSTEDSILNSLLGLLSDSKASVLLILTFLLILNNKLENESSHHITS
jgi:hypothetical protein